MERTTPRAPGRPTGATDTAEKVLREATREFAERGLHGASLRRIAACAGVSSATVLHHFGSKEAMFERALSEVADSLERTLALPTNAPDMEALLDVVSRFLDWVAWHPLKVRLVFREMLDIAGADAARARRARKWLLAPPLAALARTVEAAGRAGTVRAVDGQLFVFDLTGRAMYFALGLPTLQHMSGGEANQLAAQYRRQLLADLRASLHPGGHSS